MTILYEDDSIVAIDKPAGLIVHSDGHDTGPSVASWFADAYPMSRGVGEPGRLPDGTLVERPGIVHRIDRETSGVLVLAKTAAAYAHVKEEFRARRVEKEYLAFCYGIPKEEEGSIVLPIGRSAKDFRLKSAQRGAKGTLREAETRYRVLAGKDDYAALAVFPKTGRTHQIRVHLKAIHHPIVCDSLYAPNRPCALGFSRLALHARALSLILPSGAALEIEAPVPEEFLAAARALA